jgi:membrane-associated phospholipid phosphatase
MDIELFRAINTGWRNPFCDILFAILSYSGLGATVAVLAIPMACYKKTRIPGISIALAALIGGTVLGQTFKTLMPRERPSNMAYAITQEPHKHSSFPSSHTACAFGVAVAAGILASRRRKWLAVSGLYLWATGVGISRIYRGVHWPTDILGGALLGVIGGCLAIAVVDHFYGPSTANSETNLLPSSSDQCQEPQT